MNHEIPMLSIIARGTKQFPRYIVAKADEYKNPLLDWRWLGRRRERGPDVLKCQ